MTKHTPWINNGGRIERSLPGGEIEVLCTVGEVNNQSPGDTRKAQRIVACVNFCGEVLTDALEESNLEGMYTRGAGDDLKAMAVKFRNQRDQLRQDKAEMLGVLDYLPRPKSILEEAAYTGGEMPKKWMYERGIFINGYNGALKDVKKCLRDAIAKHGKES